MSRFPVSQASCLALGFLLIAGVYGCSEDGGTAEEISPNGVSTDIGLVGERPAVDHAEFEDLVIGRVGEQPITIGDINDKIEIQYPQIKGLDGLDEVKQKEQILNVYIDELVCNTLGEALGLDEAWRYRTTVKYARRYALADLVLKEYVKGRAQPTDTDISRFYDEHSDEFKVDERVMASHIMTRTREEANNVYDKLKAGADWDELCAEVSIDKRTAKRGGSLGAVTLENDIVGLGEAIRFKQVVLSMEVGEISEPFEGEGGWHVARVDERRPAGIRQLDEVYDAIKERLLRDVLVQTKNVILDSVRTAAGVEVYRDALDEYMMNVLSESELLAQARRTGQLPQKRIQFYEALLRRMPESASCAEAQFMIGFIYAEELGDTESARRALEIVLEKYPQSEVAASARRMLQGLGQDDTEG